MYFLNYKIIAPWHPVHQCVGSPPDMWSEYMACDVLDRTLCTHNCSCDLFLCWIGLTEFVVLSTRTHNTLFGVQYAYFKVGSQHSLARHTRSERYSIDRSRAAELCVVDVSVYLLMCCVCICLDRILFERIILHRIDYEWDPRRKLGMLSIFLNGKQGAITVGNYVVL